MKIFRFFSLYGFCIIIHVRGEEMLFFKNDYGQGCIPEILELLEKANHTDNNGYGQDNYTKKAVEMLRSKMPDTDTDIHFVIGGTICNQTIFKHILRPFEAVISTDTGHIATHETGSVEATGHKVIIIPNASGKLTAASVRKVFNDHMIQYEHMVYPKAVYISNSTELGTVYSRKELEELRTICNELNLYLVMDGARLSSALMSGVDYTLNDVAKWCDVFSIGGTKSGALFGEAICITNPLLKPYFRFDLKQNGAMLAKGWLLALQFIGLFENNSFYTIGKKENDLAQEIQDQALELGYPLFMRSDTNQIFLVINKSELEYLKERVDFDIWDYWNDDIVVRFVTSFATTHEEVEYLCVYLEEAKNLNKKEQE